MLVTIIIFCKESEITMTLRTITITTILFMIFVASGCKGPNSPRSIVTAYIKAGMAGNQDGMKSALSTIAINAYKRKSTRSTVEEALSKSVAEFSKVESFEITKIENKKSYQIVKLKFTFKDKSTRSTSWQVRQYEGKWLLDELKRP